MSYSDPEKPKKNSPYGPSQGIGWHDVPNQSYNWDQLKQLGAIQQHDRYFGSPFHYTSSGSIEPEFTYLIWSMERGMWWKPNHRGYTFSRKEAGRYTHAEALKIVSAANLASGDIPEEMMVPEKLNPSKDDYTKEAQAKLAKLEAELLKNIPNAED